MDDAGDRRAQIDDDMGQEDDIVGRRATISAQAVYGRISTRSMLSEMSPWPHPVKTVGWKWGWWVPFRMANDSTTARCLCSCTGGSGPSLDPSSFFSSISSLRCLNTMASDGVRKGLDITPIVLYTLLLCHIYVENSEIEGMSLPGGPGISSTLFYIYHQFIELHHDPPCTYGYKS